VTNQDSSSFELGTASAMHHLSLYRAASGALVFSAGTMRLQRSLAGFYNQAPAPADPRLQQAIVNLFADMNVQPGSLLAGLSPATRSTDFTPPTAQVTGPVNGSFVTVQDTVVISGTAADVGGRVAAIEVSTDGGASWHPGVGRQAWTYRFTPCSAGSYGLRARAVDDSGNIGVASPVVSINARVAAVNDFVANGRFDCGFDTTISGSSTNQLGLGWFQRSQSGSRLQLAQGGLIPGVSLQRVVAGGSQDGIGQNLTLVPGREYELTARVYIERGRAALGIGRLDQAPDLSIALVQTGRWQTVTVPYAPTHAACTMMISSEGGPATFKVDDVALAPRSTGPADEPPTISSIGPRTIDEDDSTGPIGFTVADAVTSASALTVTATTSNPGLVPVGRIVLGGGGANRTVTITPLANQSGAVDVTLRVVDGIGGSASTSFSVTVNAVNDLPTISAIGSPTIEEDETTGAIPFMVGDIETAAGALTLQATSSNAGLLPVNRIEFGGSGASRTVRVDPLANQSGTAQVTLTVRDANGGTATRSFTLTVTPVNDLPTISAIGSPTIEEDETTGAIPFTVGDIETAAGALTLQATSSNAGLLPVNRIEFGGSGASRTVRVDPLANQSGTAQVTVTVRDANGGTASTSFTLTVTSENDLPTISAIGSQNIEEDETTGAIPFTVGDLETSAAALTVQATSSNTGLLPVNRIEFGGSGASRTVRVDPLANQSGTAQVTVTVRDANGGSASTSFTLTVTAVNDLPTISAISSPTIEEDETTGAIPFTVGDIETAAGALTVQATSSNVGLLPVSRIELGGSGANRTVRVDPLANQSGTAQVTLTVRDANGGTASTSFTLTVTSGNDLPTISAIGSQNVEEDETTGAIPFTVGDLETSAATLTVQATSSNTGLLPVNRIEFGGSGASRTVRLDPLANQSGTAQVTLTVRDANGGSASTSFTLTVTAVNDLPTISAISSPTIEEDETTGTIPFTVGDLETSAAALTVQATSSNTGLLPVNRIEFGGSGASRTVRVDPVANQSGTAHVTLTVRDANGGSASTSFTLTVTAVNDLPTISAISSPTIDEDETTGPILFTVGDIETAASALTVKATTSNVSLVPASRIVIAGSGSDRTVTITPLVNQFGTADVTLTVTDGEGETASRTFTLTVNPVNDLPTISSIGAQVIDVDGTTGPILFTVGDVETAANALTVNASSSNTGLIPVSSITFSGSGATRRVTVRPTADLAGAAQITLTVSDSNGGTSDSRFIVTVGNVNPVLVENSLPGTAVRAWNPDSSVPTIRGFTDEVSVNKGGAVTFYIQTPDAAGVSYDLVVYRLGYYQGLGAREVARFTGVSVDQPTCLETPTPSLDPATDATVFPRLIDCGNWNPTWTWNTPTNLVSGLFMARVERRDTRISCGIFFVVRDDARNSDILLQTCDTSWQAYNYGPAYYGGSIPAKRTMDGHSVHDFFNPRAYKVSYRRPHLWALTNMAPPHTEIVGDNTVGAVLSYGEEYPMIRFLEANGFDVAYTTGRDSDRRGELIRNHRMFITSGHDEYWSLRQRQHIQAARDAGVNLAFFSGNTAYWKIRWEDDHHTMVVYKERLGLKLDPLPGVTTGSFRDETFGPPRYDGSLPENELNGLLTTQTSFVERALRVPEADGKLRFWRNTSVASLLPGQSATFDGLLGYQLDGDVDNGFRPSGLFHLSTTEVTDQEDSDYELGNTTIPHHLSLYRAASGALVFHAGTMRLQRALAGYYNQAPAPADARLQQAIVNLFADMGVQPLGLQPGLKVATRSTDFTAPTARVIDPRGGSCAKVEDTVVVSGSAADVGGRVAAVEVSTDGGQAWHPASGRESWTYSFTPCNAGLYSIRARAVDDSGNIGPASSSRVLNVGIPGSVDYVINGSFDCGFEELPDVGRNARLGLGWFYRSLSGAGLSLNQGGVIPGLNLQRVVARGVGDGIGQHLTLAPGREYTFVARVFVESGRVAVKFGRGDEPTEVLTRTSASDVGSWQTLRAVYVPVEADCTFMISSDRGPATFKVDDVVLTSRSDEGPFTSSLSALPGGLLQLEVLGEPGSTCCIETSTNLLDWDFLFLANPTSGRTVYPVPAAPRIPMRFFRAETP
jgi:hypothetical protein